MTLEEITQSENANRFNESSRVITNPEEIKQYLESLAEQYPTAVIKKLNPGDIIQNGNSVYVLDDLENICNRVHSLSKCSLGKIPLTPIYKSFRIPLDKFIECKANFSEVLNKGEGMCFEHAVLTHLFAQRDEKDPSYLIAEGYLMTEKGERGPHAYNLVFRGDKPFLVDSQNPLGGELDLCHYTAPVIGIKPYGNEIVVEDEWKQGREYYIL